MKHIRVFAIALLAGAPVLTAHAGDTPPAGIGREIRQELAEARKEALADLAKAKRDLDRLLRASASWDQPGRLQEAP